MFFAPKCEAKEFLKLNISNNIKEINQHSRVTCLCCILHKTMQGGAIISKVINKKHRKTFHWILWGSAYSASFWLYLLFIVSKPHPEADNTVQIITYQWPVEIVLRFNNAWMILKNSESFWMILQLPYYLNESFKIKMFQNLIKTQEPATSS